MLIFQNNTNLWTKKTGFQTFIIDNLGIGNQLIFPVCFMSLYFQENVIKRVS